MSFDSCKALTPETTEKLAVSDLQNKDFDTLRTGLEERLSCWGPQKTSDFLDKMVGKGEFTKSSSVERDANGLISAISFTDDHDKKHDLYGPYKFQLPNSK